MSQEKIKALPADQPVPDALNKASKKLSNRLQRMESDIETFKVRS
jgi:hypothetical protein